MPTHARVGPPLPADWDGVGVRTKAECEVDDSCDVDGARREPMSLWLRNIQLGVFSIPLAALLMLSSPSSRALVAAHGPLAGFTPLVWLITVLTAGGGLLVAAVVKYADNVLKTYATAIAIVITCAVGTAVTGVPPTPGFLQGMGMVLVSMLMYNGVLSIEALNAARQRRQRRQQR